MARSRRKSGSPRRGALGRIAWRGTAVAIAGVFLDAGFLAWKVGKPPMQSTIAARDAA